METLRRIQIEALRLKISQPLIFSFIIIFVAPTFAILVFSNLILAMRASQLGVEYLIFQSPQKRIQSLHGRYIARCSRNCGESRQNVCPLNLQSQRKTSTEEGIPVELSVTKRSTELLYIQRTIHICRIIDGGEIRRAQNINSINYDVFAYLYS